MNLETKKEYLMEDVKLLLSQSNFFTEKVLNLSKEIGHIDLNGLETKDVIKLINMIKSDTDMKKFNRLSLALLYVQNPTDDLILDAMLEDVLSNKKNIKTDEAIEIAKNI